MMMLRRYGAPSYAANTRMLLDARCRAIAMRSAHACASASSLMLITLLIELC